MKQTKPTKKTYTKARVKYMDLLPVTVLAASGSALSSGSGSASDKFFCGEDNKLTIEGTADLYALSFAEWDYIIQSRTNASRLYKCGVTVAGKSNCLIIAPDDYSGSIALSYTADAWETAEASGLVCLPAAGFRQGDSTYDLNSRGHYLSSSSPYPSNVGQVFSFGFYSDDTLLPAFGRSSGNSLRLVKTVE